MASAWKVVSASVTGFSHVADGTPCQDAHAVSVLDNGWFVGITSDGAGSAAHAAEGSRILCQGLLTYLAVYIDELHELARRVCLEESEIRKVIVEAVELVREKLLAETMDGSLSDFHATLVGVIAGPSGGLFFHVGDGVGCATNATEHSSFVISLPENGEYANETFFFTQHDWQSHLRLTPFGPDYNLIVLMSDGVSPFAMGPGGQEPHLPFLTPLSTYFSANDSLAGHKALVSTLESEKIRPITGDDKTLLWAMRVPIDDPVHD